jgi:hypothetical protein
MDLMVKTIFRLKSKAGGNGRPQGFKNSFPINFMNRSVKAALVTFVSFLVVIIVSWLFVTARNIYINIQERTVAMEDSLQRVKMNSHSEWMVRLVPLRIRTSDHPIDNGGYFRLSNKDGKRQKFHDSVDKASGRIISAWVSDWTPRSEISKFEELTILETGGASYDILAKVRPNESISVDVELTFILEKK